MHAAKSIEKKQKLIPKFRPEHRVGSKSTITPLQVSRCRVVISSPQKFARKCWRRDCRELAALSVTFIAQGNHQEALRGGFVPP
eukprot:4651550-Amphidinium_carterae.1